MRIWLQGSSKTVKQKRSLPPFPLCPSDSGLTGRHLLLQRKEHRPWWNVVWNIMVVKSGKKINKREHTYLHMDHTSHRDTKPQGIPPSFAPLWSKSVNTPLPPPNTRLSWVRTQQVIERQSARERDYRCHLSRPSPLLSPSLCLMCLSLSLLRGHETHTHTHMVFTEAQRYP